MADLLTNVADATTTRDTAHPVSAITLSEQITIGFVGPATTADAIALLDLPVLGFVGPASTADATATGDAPQIAFDGRISVSDSIATADSDVAYKSFAPQIQDATPTSETLKVEIGPRFVAASDTATSSETTQAFQECYVAITETTATSELASAPFPSAIAKTDFATTAEAVFAGVLNNFNVLIVEPTKTAELDLETLASNVHASDSAELPPGGPGVDENVSAADATALTDVQAVVVTPLQISVADATAVADTKFVTRLGAFSTFSSDTTQISEFFLIGFFPPFLSSTLEVAVDETIATDEASTVIFAQLVVAEATRVSENAVVGFPPIITSTVEVAVSDATATRDAVTAILVQANVNTVFINDATSTAETIKIIRTNVIAEDTTPVTETVTMSRSGGTQPPTLADVATVRDGVKAFLTISIFIAEGDPGLLPGDGLLLPFVLSETDQLGVTLFPSPSLFPRAALASTLLESPNTNIALQLRAADAAHVADSPGIARASTFSSSETIATNEVIGAVLESLVAAADAVAATELAGTTKELTVRISEATQTAESRSVEVVVPSVAALEVVAPVERVKTFVLGSFVVGIDEPVSNSELVTLATGDPQISVADSLLANDAAFNTLADLSTVTDTTSTSENIGKVLESQAFASDSALATDLAGVSKGFNVSARDAVSARDTISFQPNLFVSRVDAASVRDVPTFSGLGRLAVADSLGATDSPAVLIGNAVVQSEAVRTNEFTTSFISYFVAINDVTTTTEAVDLGVVGASAVLDVSTIGEVATGYIELANSVSDATSLADQFAYSTDFNITQQDVVDSQDGPPASRETIRVSVSDGCGTSEALAFQLSAKAATRDATKDAEAIRLALIVLANQSDATSVDDIGAGELTTGWQVGGLFAEVVPSGEHVRVIIKRRWRQVLPGDVSTHEFLRDAEELGARNA